MDSNTSVTMSGSISPSFTPFPFSKRLALFLIVQTGVVSLIAVLLLLGLILWNITRSRSTFIRKPVDYFFFGLFVSDMFRAIGHIMGVAWVAKGGIAPTTSCTVEALFRHVGAVGEALFTVTITIYTFLVIYMGWSIPKSRWIPLAVNGSIVLFLILMVTIVVTVHRDPFFYGPAKLWCWITPPYLGEKIGLEYGIFWLVALINITLYVPLFLQLHKGDEEKRLSHDALQRRSVARKMLAYPIAYIFLIVPMSIIRWIEFVNPHIEVASGWRAAAGVTFGSSGLVNALLYIITRRLLPSCMVGKRESNGSDMVMPISHNTFEIRVRSASQNRSSADLQYGGDDDSSLAASLHRAKNNV